HYLAAATTSQTDGSAPPRPLSRHAVKRLAGGLGGRTEPPARGTDKEQPPGRSLPAGGFHEFLQGGAAGTLQHVDDLGGLTALVGDWADFAPLVAFFAGLALLPDLALDGATWAFCAAARGFLAGAARPGQRLGCCRFLLECRS